MSSSQFKLTPVVAAALLAVSGTVGASSHREAPGITMTPTVDGTDFYMFRSYETKSLSGGADAAKKFVTLIANYQPLQDTYGGPNYFPMNPNGLYEIHVDNNGDGREDITFQFRFTNTLVNGKALTIGTGTNAAMVASPLVQSGPGLTTLGDESLLNLVETYTVSVVRGDRRTGAPSAVTRSNGSPTFNKPVDYIGTKTIPNYSAYANSAIFGDINIPGCNISGSKVFVGQRKEVFGVNLGTVFDLVNAPLGVISDRANENAAAPTANSPGAPGALGFTDKAVTSIAIEVPADCLKASPTGDPVIGAWTTASLRQFQGYNGAPGTGHRVAAKNGGGWTQVSRLSHPLVNELVIGLPDKDRFNASKPANDATATGFAPYVTNPTLPALLEAVFPGTQIAPTNIPRSDIANVFLLGLSGINRPGEFNTTGANGAPVALAQPAAVTPAEMMRLNTAVAPVARANQNKLGIAGEAVAKGLAGITDLAGFPNGRRPGDDVVDLSLAVVAGALCMLNGPNDALKLNDFKPNPAAAPLFSSQCAPSSVPLGLTSASLHDGIDQGQIPLLSVFPYIPQPRAGSQGPTN